MSSEVKTIVVNIDPDLEDLIPVFLENRQQNIQDLRRALGQGDLETVRIIGHSIRGSAAAYGFPGLLELGTKLESAAVAGESARARGLLEELIDHMSRLQIVYGKNADD